MKKGKNIIRVITVEILELANPVFTKKSSPHMFKLSVVLTGQKIVTDTRRATVSKCKI